ncbi:uncharacterized protein LOC115633406 [Scaptodrosophila lebanonensis]|uniref:Uncharacterized protein LOC115633406 n=1 Tax=Drosophila lebanonensis TaxID=7225 RepID=A0A6J2UEC4_DROLE|nr:uncharacterized protein LOC115633406 [Scaptodrosophila lebanonensis]
MLPGKLKLCSSASLLLLILAQWLSLTDATFGNEYVHIKVHVPKETVPVLIEPEPHKVIHHYHHHPRARGRGPPKPKSSPVLESVILSDLDNPLHMSEHAEYLNHAKELADHLSESYAAKKPLPLPPPPAPPKKKVNTYTVIEEKHRPVPSSSYEYDDLGEGSPHSVETYRVIDQRPQHHKHTDYKYSQMDSEEGYQYPAPVSRYHRGKPSSSSSSSYHGSYAEPAPVEEPQDLEQDYQPAPDYASYMQAARGLKAARFPAHTLEAPEESASSQYGYGGGGGSDFRPSPQLHPELDAYDDEPDSYVTPLTPRRRRPELDWSELNGYNRAAAESYSGIDSYSAGHVQGLGSSGYKYAGPYAH